MFKVKITVIKKVSHEDLILKYENKLDNPCTEKIGNIYISENGEKPAGLCAEAWKSMEYFVKELANGTEDFFGGWMKNKGTAMVSCNDGFRPVTFYLEAIKS